MKYAIPVWMMMAGAVLADCPAPATMYAAATGWLAGETLPDPQVATLEEGACAYAAYREGLEDDLGRPVGVKVGFTSQPAQEAFGVPGPVAGALFAPMLLEDGAEVSLSDARRALYEADLIVTVADPALAQATTREEAAAALGEIRPFVELPDLALAEGVKPSGPIFAAYGVLPWRGVMGEGIAVADLADPVGDIGALTVSLHADGELIDQSTGAALLGHPLDVVLWLVEENRSTDWDLREGAVLSLGSLGKLHPAKPGTAIKADYEVGGQAISVGFTLSE